MLDLKKVREEAEKEHQEELSKNAKEAIKEKLIEIRNAKQIVKNLERELEDLELDMMGYIVFYFKDGTEERKNFFSVTRGIAKSVDGKFRRPYSYDVFFNDQVFTKKEFEKFMDWFLSAVLPAIDDRKG